MFASGILRPILRLRNRAPKAGSDSMPHPLGPIIRFPIEGGLPTRVVALCVLIGTAGLLATAVWVQPDPRGVGTHEQLSRPACAMLELSGYPCPTCGMTTSFAHFVRGNWWTSLRVQPMGFILALVATMAAAASTASLLTGRRWLINWYRVSPAALVIGCIVLVLASWIYKAMTL